MPSGYPYSIDSVLRQRRFAFMLLNVHGGEMAYLGRQRRILFDVVIPSMTLIFFRCREVRCPPFSMPAGLTVRPRDSCPRTLTLTTYATFCAPVHAIIRLCIMSATAAAKAAAAAATTTTKEKKKKRKISVKYPPSHSLRSASDIPYS